MSEDQFWVNPDALANSAGDLHERAASLSHLLRRINDLSSPDRAEVVGLDIPGQVVWKQLQESSAELQKGLREWRGGIHGGGDSVKKSATSDATTPRFSVELTGDPGEGKRAVRSESPEHLRVGDPDDLTPPGRMTAQSDRMPASESEIQAAYLMMGLHEEGTPLRPATELVPETRPRPVLAERLERQSRRLEPEEYITARPGIPAEHVSTQTAPMVLERPVRPMIPVDPSVLDES
jgi:hypothetical protein